MNKFVKIDRIGSIAEAEAFAALGVDLLTVSLDPDPRFADDRIVTTQAAAAIGAARGGPRLVAALDLGKHRAQSPLDIARTVVDRPGGLASVQRISRSHSAGSNRSGSRAVGQRDWSS